MDRRALTGTIAIFVVWTAGSFLVHSVLLHADYAQFPNLYRTEMEIQALMPVLILAHLLLAAAFTWIYARGAEAKAWIPQGLRYGLAVAGLTVIPSYTITYVVQPLTRMMVVRQILFDSLVLLTSGLVIAYIYRNKRTA